MRRGASFRMALTVMALCLAAPAASAHAATFTVTDAGDSGPGTLRQAIADANLTTDPDDIGFSLGAGPHTIAPTSALPQISEEVAITAPTSSGLPLITLSGGSVGGSLTGLVFAVGSKNSSLTGLRVSAWTGNGVGVNANAVAISSCVIETNGVGVSVAGADAVQIGPGGRNVISGNSNDGIRLNAANDTRIAGNWIGLASDGTTSAGNSSGVDLIGAATGTVIDGNTLVANTAAGVRIAAPTATQTRVEGNLIGLRSGFGVPAQGNGNGVLISTGSHGNTIGGGGATRRNVISGNGNGGVVVTGAGSNSNTVSGNWIGLSATGLGRLPNVTGVLVGFGATDTTVGGTTPDERNVIGWNATGVALTGSGTTTNRVTGNYVGVAPDGQTRAPNTRGVAAEQAASGNTIGGSVAGAGNVISANLQTGIQVWQGTSDTVVRGNLIGLGADGKSTRGNGRGVWVGGAGPSSDHTLIGGPAALQRNVISANDEAGIYLNGPAADTTVEGNYVGLDATGSINRGNNAGGVEIPLGSVVTGTTIGGAAAGAGNVVSGNADGIKLAAGDVDILGNRIGTNAAGDAPLPPVQERGVVVFDATDVSIGGTGPGTGNTIAFNGSGVDISPGGLHDPVRGNRIFSNSGGLGIDLGLFDGVTPNDTLDADSGANALQNFPILNSAVTDAGATAIAGVLDSAPNASFSVDLYASSACDVSGNGEGERPIGTVAVNTDGAGHAAFAVAASPEIPAGQLVTATATSADANTSEFSACRGVTVPPAPPPDPPAAQAPVTEPPRDDPAPPPVVVQA